MSNWRMKAKHFTRCPRCGDVVNVGNWIVQEDSGKRIHSVCPRDLRPRVTAPKEPTVYEEWTMGTDGKMQVEVKENV